MAAFPESCGLGVAVDGGRRIRRRLGGREGRIGRGGGHFITSRGAIAGGGDDG
jgi:hypothetical protein